MSARREGIASVSFAHDGPFARLLNSSIRVTAPADVHLPHYRLAPSWFRRVALRQSLQGLTHLLNEGNVPFSGDPRSTSFASGDAKLIADLGLRSGVVFHGTDARDPYLSMSRHDYSFFRDADADWIASVAQRAAQNRAQVEELGVQTFVTTPDMLLHVPGATLLPISVDATRWSDPSQALSRGVPRVLHRSSRSNLTKGSRHIIPVLEELHALGRIVMMKTPVVSNERMVELVKSADIVVDQLQTGTYGVTGVEAMAAGRLVVANIDAHLALSDQDRPPIVHATPASFRETFLRILASLDEMRQTAAQGPEFVRRVHDGTEAARVLRAFLSSSSG